MKPNLNELPKLAKDTHNETKKYLEKLKKKTPKNLDYVMQDLHDDEFKKPIVYNALIVVKQPDHFLRPKILKELPSIFVKNRNNL